jgi:hypothetical protein
MPHPTVLSLLALLTLGLGCKPDEAEILTGLPDVPGENPLVPDVPMFPFPSDFYLEEDPDTLTGRRLALDDRVMPQGVSAATLATADGFSRAPAILAWFEGGLDAASLPDIDDPGAAMASDATVRLIRQDSWEPVPLLVELDLNTEDLDEQALIIRPQDILEPATGYVVILTDGLRGADGQSAPPVSEAFRALRDGIETDSSTVEAQRDDFTLVNEAIVGVGLEPERVVLAWSFHTRSAEQVQDPLIAMQDATVDWDLTGWSITDDAWDDDGQNRLIHGVFEAPDYLGEDDTFTVDDRGLPVIEGTREVEFMVTIPVTASTETRPAMVFGHGFFSSLEEPTWSSLNNGLQRWRMAAATTNFIGFCEDDLVDTMGILGSGLDGVTTVVAQQMQSHVHQTLLGRLMAEELSEAITAEDGTPLIDGDSVHYMGISNGGTQGLVIMTASPFFERGVLDVPGGGWTHMLQRAVQWNTMGTAFSSQYDDPLDLQLEMSLLQLVFDPIDSLNWVEHLAQDRLPGRPDVRVSLQEAVGDCQVSNMVTEWVARAGDIPLVTPSPREVWGLEEITAEPPEGTERNAALLIYDEGYDPLPSGNLPPEEENGAHATVRRLEGYLEHVGAFMEDGTIAQFCDGACDPD